MKSSNASIRPSSASALSASLRTSLSTKMLLGVTGLLSVLIALLVISAIYLLQEDKRAYTYQSLGTSSSLISREFLNRARYQVDTLKIALGGVPAGFQLDWMGSQPKAFEQVKTLLQGVVKNQSELQWIGIGNLKASQVELIVSQSKDDFSFQLNEEFKSRIESLSAELEKNLFAFVPLSQKGILPRVGVVIAQTTDNGLRIALGVSSLAELAETSKGMSLTIASQSGRILFDSDPSVLFSNLSLADDPVFRNALESQVNSGVKESISDQGRWISSFSKPGMGLVILNRVDWEKANRSTYELVIQFALLGLMGVGVGIIFALLFSKSLTRPLQKLYSATQQIAAGNFDLKMPVGSSDEIGALTQSFNVMSKQISDLIASQAEKIHLENELMIASTVQQTLIPPPHFKGQSVVIRSHYQAATHCGGDWWGFFEVGNRLCVMIADATGHGVSSALITASARSCFSVIQKIVSENPGFPLTPESMLSIANRVVYDASMGKIMMTFFVGVIDFDQMKITYASAGHNPPWLFKKSEQGFELQSLAAAGVRLGEGRDISGLETLEKEIHPGDILFMYTDGLIECKDQSGKMYSKKRLKKQVEAHLHQGIQVVVDQLMKDFTGFTSGKTLDDDVTLSTVQILHRTGSGVEGTS